MLLYVFQVQNHRLEKTCFLTVKQINSEYEHMQEEDVILQFFYTVTFWTIEQEKLQKLLA